MAIDLKLEVARQLQNLKNNQGPSPHFPNKFPLAPGDAWVTKGFLDVISQSQNNMGAFLQYILQMNYFSGRYTFTGDKELNRVEQLLFENTFNFGLGAVHIKKIGEKITYIPVGATKIMRGLNGKITEAQGLHNLIIGRSNKMVKEFKLTAKDTAFLWSNQWMLPGFFFWWEFCKGLNDKLDLLNTNIKTSIKKYVYSLSNNSSKINAIEKNSFLDPKNPFVVRIANPTTFFSKDERKKDNALATANANVIAPLDTTKGDPLLIETIEKWISLWYFHLGRRINTERKKQRNIDNEVKSQEANYLILEKNFERQLDNFTEQISRLTKQKIGWRKTIDEIDNEPSDILDKEQNG